MTCPTIHGLSGCRALSGLLLQAFSYGSETAAWPLKSLGPLPAASIGLSSHPLSFRLPFPAAELCPGFAQSFLWFRDCRLPPQKPIAPLPAASSGLSSHPSSFRPQSSARTLLPAFSYGSELSDCRAFSYASETAAWPLKSLL